MVARGGTYGDLHGDGREVDPIALRTSNDMTPSFEADLPKTLRRILDGGTIRTGCGIHMIEKHGDGVLMSRATAEWVFRQITKSR